MSRSKGKEIMITLPEDMKRKGITEEDIEACVQQIFRAVRKKTRNESQDTGEETIEPTPNAADDIQPARARKSQTESTSDGERGDGSTLTKYQAASESTGVDTQPLNNELIHPQIMRIIEQIFPGTNGIKFLASISRYAEIKQNSLPGMEELGEHVAIIQVRTLHHLAEKIGWGYDTTHKYIVVLCALNLLYRRRSGGQSQIIFPFQRYLPPANLQALDTLITQSRPKVRQFARGVKERYLHSDFLSRAEPSSEPQNPTSQGLQQRLLDLLDEEGIESTRRQRIALRIVSEVFGQLVGTKGSVSEKMQKIAPPTAKVPTAHPPATAHEGHNRVPKREEMLPAPKKVYPRDTQPTSSWQTWSPEQPSQRSAEDIIKAASENKRIPGFALAVLKKGLMRNANFRQQQKEESQEQESTSSQGVDLLTNHASENSGYKVSSSLSEYPTQIDTQLLPVHKMEAASDHNDTRDSSDDTSDHTAYQDRTEAGAYYEEASAPVEGRPTRRREDTAGQRTKSASKGSQDYTKKRPKSTVRDTGEFRQRNESSPEVLSTQRKKQSTWRMPQKVDLSDYREDVIRNYGTSLYNFINYLFEDETSRKNHELERFLAYVFDEAESDSVKVKWYTRLINHSSAASIRAAFLEMAVALFAARNETINNPGAMFVKRCERYNTCEWHILENSLRAHTYLSDLSYEQLIDYLDARRGMVAKEIVANSMAETREYLQADQEYGAGQQNWP